MTSVAERIAALKKKEKSGVPALIQSKSASFKKPVLSKFASERTSNKGSIVAREVQKLPGLTSAKSLDSTVTVKQEQPNATTSVKDRIRLLQQKSSSSIEVKQAKPQSKGVKTEAQLVVTETCKEEDVSDASENKSEQAKDGENIKTEIKKAPVLALPIPKRPTKESIAAKEEENLKDKIKNIHHAKVASKKIKQLAGAIPIPGLPPRPKPGLRTTEADNHSEVKIEHLSMKRPKMAAGRRRKPRTIRAIARTAVELEKKEHAEPKVVLTEEAADKDSKEIEAVEVKKEDPPTVEESDVVEDVVVDSAGEKGLSEDASDGEEVVEEDSLHENQGADVKESGDELKTKVISDSSDVVSNDAEVTSKSGDDEVQQEEED